MDKQASLPVGPVERRSPEHALRDQLPGLEPERRVTDWGRSEVFEEVLDRTLYGFLYHYWHRVEARGLENVPVHGPALLVANRAGAVPADAALIATAIKEEHPRPRPVHFAAGRALGAVPGLDMLIVKAGGVSAHAANLHRLLFDEGQLVLAFPEGAPSLRERGRLAVFAREGTLAAAVRAGAPIVPVAALGGELAAPALARMSLRALRIAGLAATAPVPAKVRLRFLEPVWPEEGMRVRDLAEEVRGRIDVALLELLDERRGRRR